MLAFGFAARAAAAGPFEEARAAEERYAFDEALALYEQAPNGAERAAWLRARSEGDFEPLLQLEHARRDPSPDLERLVIAADAYPEGLVRVEAWSFAADAHARRGHPELAIPLWRKAARDPKADPVLAHAAIRSAVRVHLAAGDLGEAKVDLQWLPDEGAAKDVDRHVRRRRLHIASIATIAVGLLAVARAVRRARRVGLSRASVLAVLAFSAFVALAGAALALGYEGASAGPFLWFGAALVPLLLAARAWAAAGGAPRGVRAVVCALGVAAAAFLVLEQSGHLDALGL
ncbi:MAG: hypothetical protein U0270_24410 [Labilithrix sp.]